MNANEEDLKLMRALLKTATAAIEPEYFQLPVASTSAALPARVNRERVYAYELYHQLRSAWPEWRYSLGGEVDKAGHPLVRGGLLDRAKPDLLVHVPGQMDGNLLVVEIKSLPSTSRALKQDLAKLRAFLDRSVGYQEGVLLVFGATTENSQADAQRLATLCGSDPRATIWHHAKAGMIAVPISLSRAQSPHP